MSKSNHIQEPQDQDTSCYIDFLNKDKNFRQDRKTFKSLDEAVKWGKKNLSNYHPDMVKMSSYTVKIY